MQSQKVNLVLDYDDFHWKEPENCLIYLNRFISVYPKIKVNLFTSANYQNKLLSDNKEWCNKVRKLIESDNIRLCVHGFTHLPTDEFKYYDYSSALVALKAAETEFENAGLPYLKVFKGPGWGINRFTSKVLEENNYTHIYINEHTNEDLLSENTKKIRYNWNLKDEPSLLLEYNNIIAHGHSWNVCSNGIGETFAKVVNFIYNNKEHIEFKFANEI